jgi:hypothetical protein
MSEEEMKASVDQVAEILLQLKEQVRRDGQQEDSTPLVSRARQAPLTSPPTLERVHAATNVNPHLPIAWPTWPRGLWPKVQAVFQKVVRRLLRWYINPIVEQQNHFNAAVAQSLDVLWWEISRLQSQVVSEENAMEDESG